MSSEEQSVNDLKKLSFCRCLNPTVVLTGGFKSEPLNAGVYLLFFCTNIDSQFIILAFPSPFFFAVRDVYIP